MNQANQSIECEVKKCKYHCDDENYCPRNSIQIGTPTTNSTINPCTDCQSFQSRD